MKLNWGTGIALVYGTFVVGMLTLVFASRRSDPGLVSDKYYDLDLNYQAHMVKKQNAANLSEGLPVQFDAAKKTIRIQFPQGADPIQGSVKIYRAEDLKEDQTIDIQVDAQNVMEIPAEGFLLGVWHLNVDWTAGGKTYYFEKSVTVTHA